MDHLDEMARAGRAGMHIALGDARIEFFPARSFGDLAGTRRQALEDGIKAIHHGLVAADHHAITALQPPNAARGADIDIFDATFPQVFGAADIVLEEGVAAIDHHIALR